MFLRSDHDLQAAGGAALALARAPIAPPGPLDRWRATAATIDWTPDLGARIGSLDWWRGLVTCTALIAGLLYTAPRFEPMPAATPAPLSGADWEEARSQAIAPLAWGATSGRRMAANDLVRPLAESPERPIEQRTATFGAGDDFARVLQRAGVGAPEAASVTALIARAVPLASLKPGMQIDLTLGRRPNRQVPRPIEAMTFRARFDLNVAVTRVGAALVVTPQPIAIDNTPLRLRGIVGASLYRSARAAGAPAKAVESYLRALATRLSVGSDVRADHVFDIIIERARAATGEVQLGQLLYAGLERDGRKVQLVRWDDDGRANWYDASGTGERRGQMAMPVDGRLTSNYGVRYHPILGMMKMHKGIDIGAPYGSPIRAAMDGVVTFAGRNGGYGNFVKLAHSNGLVTGYGHMSRIAVRPGTRVSQGQLIGYVGSTGLSTGPHLHYELWRGGVSINPRSVSYSEFQRLTGDALRRFKAKVAALLAVRPGA